MQILRGNCLKNCMAANIILGVNKLRYNDDKGDLCGFIYFLEKHNLSGERVTEESAFMCCLRFHDYCYIIENEIYHVRH